MGLRMGFYGPPYPWCSTSTSELSSRWSKMTNFHEKHRGLARTIAAKYRHLEYEDAVQEATIALWRAGEHYDPSRGSEAAFACKVIHNALRNTKPQRDCASHEPHEAVWWDKDNHKYEDLEAALQRLPLSWQKDVDLVYGLRGPAFPLSIVATLQGTCKQAVHSRVQKATAKLKEYLS